MLRCDQEGRQRPTMLVLNVFGPNFEKGFQILPFEFPEHRMYCFSLTSWIHLRLIIRFENRRTNFAWHTYICWWHNIASSYVVWPTFAKVTRIAVLVLQRNDYITVLKICCKRLKFKKEYILGVVTSTKLRSAVGHNCPKNWSRKLPTRSWWCCRCYIPRIVKTIYKGLDWTIYEGLCTQTWLHPGLAQPSSISGCQTGGWFVEGRWGKPPVSQHATPRWDFFQKEYHSKRISLKRIIYWIGFLPSTLKMFLLFCNEL